MNARLAFPLLVVKDKRFYISARWVFTGFSTDRDKMLKYKDGCGCMDRYTAVNMLQDGLPYLRISARVEFDNLYCRISAAV